VSTLMLKYSAAASRSSNRGPEPTRPEDGWRDAEDSVLRARALSGRDWPAASGPPSVPTSSLIGFTVGELIPQVPAPGRFGSAGQFLSLKPISFRCPRPPDTATLVVSGGSGSGCDYGAVSASPARARPKPATPARAGDSSGASSLPQKFFRPCEARFTGNGDYHLSRDPR
jgi:hypothetical protein